LRPCWRRRSRNGGLKFYDGSPVRAADAVASILRWKDRDVVGKALFSAGATLEVVDDLTFTLALSDPFGPVLMTNSAFAIGLDKASGIWVR
jgi:peptide/nickel transport system substrate-binding protein